MHADTLTNTYDTYTRSLVHSNAHTHNHNLYSHVIITTTITNITKQKKNMPFYKYRSGRCIVYKQNSFDTCFATFCYFSFSLFIQHIYILPKREKWSVIVTIGLTEWKIRVLGIYKNNLEEGLKKHPPHFAFRIVWLMWKFTCYSNGAIYLRFRDNFINFGLYTPNLLVDWLCI